MLRRITTRWTLVAAACALAASVPAQAVEWTCSGTLYPPAADHSTGPGTIDSGSYTDTLVSDDSYEVLKESLSGGVSKLVHAWRFDDIPPPATTVYLIYEGNRPANAEGDNFKFSGAYDTSEGPFHFLTTAVINKAFELQGGIKHDLQIDMSEIDIEDTTTVYIYLKDTNVTSGTSLTNVNIDFIALCVE